MGCGGYGACFASPTQVSAFGQGEPVERVAMGWASLMQLKDGRVFLFPDKVQVAPKANSIAFDGYMACWMDENNAVDCRMKYRTSPVLPAKPVGKVDALIGNGSKICARVSRSLIC